MKSAQSFDRAPRIRDHAKIFIKKYLKTRKINTKKVVRPPMEIDHFVSSYSSVFALKILQILDMILSILLDMLTELM